ncbi:SRPBCC family protein [Leekyejoonella antrihumi]|uniref:SRPBCC family protein n=1 Tax=Leekyejoonella antrihumi TaxID=1660198 RepID=A0A563E410_9MICO|nr:SRPBCC family protein [Leekyejoonella antrihumi]TWP36983.1 SRPBCC family protein [Leekyejoonella antrihumi]
MADSTRSTIEIAAPPAHALDVIADFNEYPSWAGQVKSATVLAEDNDGWAEQVEFVLDAGVIKDTYTLAYDWDIDETGVGTVSWNLVKSTMLKSLDGSYRLEESAAGTNVTYQLSVDVSIPVIGMLRRKAEKMIIDSALKGLKKRAES